MTERAASSPRGTGSLADALARVPAELRAEARWVCWRREERGGRATKLPVCAANGRMAKSTDPATWATFEDAVAAVGRWRCDGVGFVFGPDRASTGLDLDHVIEDGVLDAAYRWVVEWGACDEIDARGLVASPADAEGREPSALDGENLDVGWFPLDALPTPLVGSTERRIEAVRRFRERLRAGDASASFRGGRQ